MDRTGHRICRNCKRRWVQPTEVYKQGKRKGEQQDNCRVCKSDCKASEFPANLVLTKDELNFSKKQPELASLEKQWLDSLTSEQGSVLLHPLATMKALPHGMKNSGISYATHEVHWDAVEERLRDVYLLDRLFVGFETLQKHYKPQENTVHPIGLLAVSLNNCATRSSQPCKSCLLSSVHIY